MMPALQRRASLGPQRMAVAGTPPSGGPVPGARTATQLRRAPGQHPAPLLVPASSSSSSSGPTWNGAPRPGPYTTQQGAGSSGYGAPRQPTYIPTPGVSSSSSNGSSGSSYNASYSSGAGRNGSGGGYRSTYTPPPLSGGSYSGSNGSSSSGGARSGSGAGAESAAEDPAKRTAELVELLQETFKVVLSTGPRGLARGLQAAEAVSSLIAETLRTGAVDPPQVILRKLFERLGTTYIKLGQFIASSPSLFPDEYVLEFQKCLDAAPPVPFSSIKRIVEQELGRPMSEVFSSVEETPLASASVAQVHSAVLRESGAPVVLKVLKPGVEDTVATDMAFVYLLSRYLEFIQPDLSRLSLTGVLSDIRTSMLDEVDFTKEAQHITHFSQFVDAQGLRSQATCPFVYKALSSKRLLVMERFFGVSLTDYDAIRSVTRRDPEAVLVAALNTWFASVLSAETFHADVHAGNLLVLSDGRVAFIDFGIVGRISPVTWRAVETLMASMATADYETMARALATIGACKEEVDYNAFARDLEAFFAELEQVNTNVVVQANIPSASRQAGRPSVAASLEIDQQQLNRLFLSLVRVSETHGIKFPREFGLFLKQLLYFDRYTRLLAPQLQILSDSRVRSTGSSGGFGGPSRSLTVDYTL